MSALLDTIPSAQAPVQTSPGTTPPPTGPAVASVPAPAPAPPSDWFVWACPCCQATLRTLSSVRRGNCPACGSLIEAPEPPAPAPACAPTAPAPAPKPALAAVAGRWFAGWRRAVVPLGMTAAVGVLAVSAIQAVRAQPWKRLGLGRSAPAVVRPPTTEELKQQLGAFVHARNWSAKRGFILDADRLESRGRDYYNGRDPDSVQLADFQPWSVPGAGPKSGILALRAERPGQRPVIAAFGPTKTGWKLDWELFSQTYDESIPQFLTTPAFAIRTFRAQVQRVFDPSTPENSIAVAISDPLDEGQRTIVVLPMGTPIATDVAKGLPDTRQRPATVELCWARPNPEGDWVPMLQRLVCWGWNGLTGRPDRGTPAQEANERFIVPSSPPLASAPPSTETTPDAAVSTAP